MEFHFNEYYSNNDGTLVIYSIQSSFLVILENRFFATPVGGAFDDKGILHSFASVSSSLIQSL